MTQSSGPPSNPIAGDDPLLHQFTNHLSVIVGFSELLLRDLAQGDPKRDDIMEMQKAAQAAMALLPQLAARMR